MTSYVALLRAVNVGGTGKMPMADLRALCTDAGFADVRTYIASGNVVFSSDLTADRARAVLQDRLRDHAGKPVGVIVLTGARIRAVLAGNPFPEAPGNRVMAVFLGADPPDDAAAQARNHTDEEIVPGKGVLYVHYPGGMGQSRLVIPAAAAGTARNLNTVAKLAEMAL